MVRSLARSRLHFRTSSALQHSAFGCRTKSIPLTCSVRLYNSSPSFSFTSPPHSYSPFPSSDSFLDKSLRRESHVYFRKGRPLSPFRAHSSVSPARLSLHSAAAVPEHFRDLYNALDTLGSVGSAYINPSRFQLALRGLEGGNAVTRVAILASDGAVDDARKLVRLLLADPLSPAQSWESTIQSDDSSRDDGRNIFIRYGETVLSPEIAHPNLPLKTVPVNSRVLQNHNIELLLAGLGLDLGESSSESPTRGFPRLTPRLPPRPLLSDPVDTLLVPALQTATSGTGLVANLRYPVHKTIVVLKDLNELLGYARLISGEVGIDKELIRLVIKASPTSQVLSSSPLTSGSSQSQELFLVPVDACLDSLDKTRLSVSNAAEFERRWASSTLPELSKWIVGETRPGHESNSATPSSRKPVIDLIHSLVAHTASQIDLEEHTEVLVAKERFISLPVRRELEARIEEWSQRAHLEIRGDTATDPSLNSSSSMDSSGPVEGADVFSSAAATSVLSAKSRSWKKLSWWRLFGRVDDVPVLLAGLLDRAFLPRAEQELIWLSGRIEQALNQHERNRSLGFSKAVSVNPPSSSTSLLFPGRNEPESALHSTTTTATPTLTMVPTVPWPTLIPDARTSLSHRTLPPLISLSQSLVIQTSITIASSSALGLLCYLPASGLELSVLEAASISGLGIVIALRNLQRTWESEREKWRRTVLDVAADAAREQVRQLRARLVGKQVWDDERMEGQGDENGRDGRNDGRKDSDDVAVSRVKEKSGEYADRRDERMKAREAIRSVQDRLKKL